MLLLAPKRSFSLDPQAVPGTASKKRQKSGATDAKGRRSLIAFIENYDFRLRQSLPLDPDILHDQLFVIASSIPFQALMIFV